MSSECRFSVDGGSGVRTRGVRGSKLPPLKIFKEMFLERTAFFRTEIAETALMYFCVIQLAYKIVKNFHCDAIIALPVVKLFGCTALNVDDCRKSESFLF